MIKDPQDIVQILLQQQYLNPSSEYEKDVNDALDIAIGVIQLSLILGANEEKENE